MPTLFKTCVICNNSWDRDGNQYCAEGGESCTQLDIHRLCWLTYRFSCERKGQNWRICMKFWKYLIEDCV